MSATPLRVPFVIHWADTPRPDLTGLIDPIRIPFTTIAPRNPRRTSADGSPPPAPALARHARSPSR